MPTTESNSKNAHSGGKAASKIAEYLRREIVTGNLRPGDKLKSERLLTEYFDVSRPTLREAMRLLESEALISISRGQHGGAHVIEFDVSVPARQVGILLQMEGTTLQDVWEARFLIEPHAARCVAESADPTVIAALKDCIKNAKAATKLNDGLAHADAISGFTKLLMTNGRNNTLSLIGRLLHDIIQKQSKDVAVRTDAAKGVERMRQLNVRSHEKLLKFIEEGEAEEAEQFWKLHLQNTAKVVLSAYKAKMPIDVLDNPDRIVADLPTAEPRKASRKQRKTSEKSTTRKRQSRR